MSYPIKDKTKVDKIKDDFEKEMNDLIDGKKTYEEEITRLRNKAIPQTLKDKLIDTAFGKTHAFEEMLCNHTEHTKLKMLQCERCQYDKREIEAENLIDSLTGDEKTHYTGKDIDGNPVDADFTLKELKIVRGSLDDVIGFKWSWG